MPLPLQTLRNDNVGIFSSTGERVVLVNPWPLSSNVA